jgi:hypothetical protein
MIDVVGLDTNPPRNAIVLCFDGKSQIHTLDRTQPSLPMKQGRPQTIPLGRDRSFPIMTLTNSTPLMARAHDGGVHDDSDPAARPTRRMFTAEQKLAILAADDEAAEPGAEALVVGGQDVTQG